MWGGGADAKVHTSNEKAYSKPRSSMSTADCNEAYRNPPRAKKGPKNDQSLYEPGSYKSWLGQQL